MKKLVLILSVSMFLFANYAGAKEISQAEMQRYSAYYSNGMQYFNNQQYSSAIFEFKKVLRFSPYDKTTQKALANAYYARAEYYRQQTKEVKKALTDYKSAYFYAKYWQDDSLEMSFANATFREIHSLENRLASCQSDEMRFQNAKILRAQGELAAAGYDLQQLKTSKYQEEVYENLGNIYKNLNNLALAMEYFKTAIDINPKNPKSHFLYGVMLDEAKNYEASMEQYNLALQYGDKSPELLEILENKWTQNLIENPNNSQAYVNLGAIYQKQGRYEEAQTQYRKALKLNPDDEVILHNLASLYTEQNEYQEAISVYNELLAKNPKNVEVLEYKATALEKLSKYDEAIAQYQAILAIKPNDANAKAKIDDIVLNHFSGAKLQQYIAQTASKNPTNYEAQFNYAYELHKNNQLTQAVEYYSKAMAINPSKEETYLNIAKIYIEQKNYQKASDVVNKGLMIMPNNAELNKYLADIKNYNANNQFETATKLYEQQKYKEAINEYLKIQNKTDEVNSAIAGCYWQLNDYSNANKYYKEILENQPNNVEYLSASAWAYYSLNDYDNAKTTANKILTIEKNNTDAKNILSNIEENDLNEMLQKGIAEYEKADYNSALSTLNTYLNKKPNEEYGIYYKALTLDELKKNSDAIKQYKLLISKNPNFAEAYYSLAVDLDNQENYKDAVVNYDKFISLKNGTSDDMTKFATSRTKELKEYLKTKK